MRGSLTLFSNIFEATPAPSPAKKINGRSAELNDQRNEALIARYYFYGKFFDNKLAYNYIINTVAAEFWLSQRTVFNIIDDNYEALIMLKKQQPTVKFFKEKWPHLSWPV